MRDGIRSRGRSGARHEFDRRDAAAGVADLTLGPTLVSSVHANSTGFAGPSVLQTADSSVIGPMTSPEFIAHEDAFMDIKTIVAAHGRDARIDLFRGIANLFIFLDHIPNNVVNWITVRNYGFSGAADMFIFISGYAASIVYAKMTLERGFVVGASRIVKRVWQLYAAYVVLFVIYIVAITDVAARYAVPDIIYEFNVAGLLDHPIRTLIYGLLLQSTPLNLDLLQLYIILMLFFPPVLWLMLRKPDFALAGSAVLYFAARRFDWNLRSVIYGHWYFNPFCWQLLFVLGAWLALGGTQKCRSLLKSPALFYFASAIWPLLLS